MASHALEIEDIVICVFSLVPSRTYRFSKPQRWDRPDVIYHMCLRGEWELAVDPHVLGKALRWEPSRQGALFPHLYGTLPVSAVRSVHDIPLDVDGVPRLPSLG